MKESNFGLDFGQVKGLKDFVEQTNYEIVTAKSELNGDKSTNFSSNKSSEITSSISSYKSRKKVKTITSENFESLNYYENRMYNVIGLGKFKDGKKNTSRKN